MVEIPRIAVSEKNPKIIIRSHSKFLTYFLLPFAGSFAVCFARTPMFSSGFGVNFLASISKYEKVEHYKDSCISLKNLFTYLLEGCCYMLL